MILYFCSKIIEENLTTNFLNVQYNYPVIYPSTNVDDISKKDVFYKTLKSYSKLVFTKVILRIEFEEDKKANEGQLLNFINSIWPKELIDIKFDRPSNVNEWLIESDELISKYGHAEPVLVVMNHDHPFIDYNPKVFMDMIDLVFQNNEINTDIAFYYSHAPEVIKWLKFGRDKCIFKETGSGIYQSNVEKKWIDSIVVINFKTLRNIWGGVNFKGDYIGRFDWKGVEFKNFNVNFFAFPREFFRHFDGYGHTTGIRLSSILDLESEIPFKFPLNSENKELVEFYFQLWKDNFLQLVEAYVESNFFSLKYKKQIFIDALQLSMNLFVKGYLDYDLKYGLISKKQYDKLLLGIFNLIYYHANSIYNDINVNQELKSNFIKTPLVNLYKKIFK